MDIDDLIEDLVQALLPVWRRSARLPGVDAPTPAALEVGPQVDSAWRKAGAAPRPFLPGPASG